jgi:methionyl-tRNA formyltransferase
MRVVFLGTPEFAVPSLGALVSRHEVIAVFTQPDRPKGRAQQLAKSAVKIAAEELKISVYQPERVRRPESFELLQSFHADIMVVVGYGQIIPQAIIDLPRLGILNVHASLLPKYRGAAPIQWAIANGERETGVTIMRIDAGLDTGDMLLKAALPIEPDETAPMLSARLAPLGAQLLLQAMEEIAAETSHPEKQDNTQATLARILKKEDGLIDWKNPAAMIYNRFRGFNPWPGAYTTFRGQQMSVTAMRLTEQNATGARPGQLMAVKKRLLAACGDGSAIEFITVQPAGKKPMNADAFLNGYKLETNETFGEIS